jgi:pyruvate kinase
VQKTVIKLCNYAAKPVILASQFLDSMIFNPFATRAEISDIHSAVIDGADGLLLNAETAVGKYPFDALITMNDVCTAAETHFPYQEFFLDMLQHAKNPMTKSEAVANSVVKSAFNLHSPIILAETDIGRVPRFLSKYRPFS